VMQASQILFTPSRFKLSFVCVIFDHSSYL
jgi:hypothetical protein